MAEYIDREALRKLMYEEAFEKDSDMQRWDSGCWIRYKLFENCIKAIPAADVVEVVRCGECKHYDCEDGDQKCVKDAEWVEDDACYYGFISYHGPEFYCAWGKRKDGGQDNG